MLFFFIMAFRTLVAHAHAYENHLQRAIGHCQGNQPQAALAELLSAKEEAKQAIFFAQDLIKHLKIEELEMLF